MRVNKLFAQPGEGEDKQAGFRAIKALAVAIATSIYDTSLSPRTKEELSHLEKEDNLEHSFSVKGSAKLPILITSKRRFHCLRLNM